MITNKSRALALRAVHSECFCFHSQGGWSSLELELEPGRDTQGASPTLSLTYSLSLSFAGQDKKKKLLFFQYGENYMTARKTQISIIVVHSVLCIGIGVGFVTTVLNISTLTFC